MYAICLVYFTVKTEEDEETCKLYHNPILRHVTTIDGCVSKEKINVTECRGNCYSKTEASTVPPGYKKCHCCKPKSEYLTKINVTCTRGGEVEEKEAELLVITECECGPHRCEATASHRGEEIRNEDNELVDMKKKRRRRALSRLFALPP